MEIIQIAAISLLAVFVAVELKAQKAIYALLISAGVILLILFFSLDKMGILMGQLQILVSKTNASGQFGIIFKALGVSYLCEITSGICQDAGFSSIASQIKIFAKIYIILLGVPVLLAFIDVLELFPG